MNRTVLPRWRSVARRSATHGAADHATSPAGGRSRRDREQRLARVRDPADGRRRPRGQDVVTTELAETTVRADESARLPPVGGGDEPGGRDALMGVPSFARGRG
ncbi:hypothetical protein Shyhy02_41570 [Streptomyces hygroscopicus subsp. hygroscopicus]|nr:hypothetical protein Shyhy02_41570 [Streptomyces hygroscopicus subsp. hygroscopicus]